MAEAQVIPTQRPTPNAEQQQAIDLATQHFTGRFAKESAMVIEGPAGTGKSFSASMVLENCQKAGKRIALTATTNKAAKVLRKTSGENTCTIYSLLGLRVAADGEEKRLHGVDEEIDLSDFDGILVDEAGMSPKALVEAMARTARETGIRFLFLGDPYQLPPVGEKASTIWTYPNKVVLDKVMRHDNQILKLVTRLRQAMQSRNLNVTILDDNDGSKGVWKLPKGGFLGRVLEFAEEGKFQDSDSAKVIAWRNATVTNYNQEIRKRIFGEKCSTFEIGEKIIAASPCRNIEDKLLLATDEEACVVKIEEGRHPTFPQFATYELLCRTDYDSMVSLRILHPSSQKDHWNACEEMKQKAKADFKQWKMYWQLRELFHEVKYSYAITAHRSQGSTYETAFVDYLDILANRERYEAMQCLYVGTSRPSDVLYLA